MDHDLFSVGHIHEGGVFREISKIESTLDKLGVAIRTKQLKIYFYSILWSIKDAS